MLLQKGSFWEKLVKTRNNLEQMFCTSITVCAAKQSGCFRKEALYQQIYNLSNTTDCWRVCQEQQFDNWDGLAGSVESSTCCQRGKDMFRHWLTHRNSAFFSWNPGVHTLKFRTAFMFWNICMHPSSSNLLAGWGAACGELSTDCFLFVCF